jgi:hypothetical protein
MLCERELIVTKPILEELATIGKQMPIDNRMPNMDEVICPGCGHQFRAIPQNVQEELAVAQAKIDSALKRERDLEKLLLQIISYAEKACGYSNNAEIGKGYKTSSDLLISKLSAKIAELEAQRTATDKWMRYTENLLEKYRSIVVVVSSGMQPEDYGRPEVTIVRFQNMIDEVLKNG